MISSEPTRIRIRSITIFLALLIATSIGSGGHRAFPPLSASDAIAAEFDPSLVEALRRAAPHEKVPIIIVLEEQGIPSPERDRIRELPRTARRAEVRARLQSLAEDKQLDVLRFLQTLEEQGQAEEIRPLYLINAIAARVEAERVYGLLMFSVIRKILWDPDVPLSQMTDEGPAPSGGWKETAPPAANSSAPIIWWQLNKVRAPECWAAGYNGAGVVVGLVDSGCDYLHSDLASHIYVNPNEIAGNGADDDSNGFIDDIRGWDFTSDDNDPMGSDQNDHGTLVAGIVAGDGTDGIQTGVAPGATILPIRVGGNWSEVFEGMDYAVLMDVDIIQMSLTQKWRFNPKPDYGAWRAITDNELMLGFFHANSIGNEGDNQASDPIPFNISAPGCCPSPWLSPGQYLAGGPSSVIGVGATDQSDIAADYSSRGPFPWEDIQASWPQYPYSMPVAYQDYPLTTNQGGLIKPDVCAPGPDTRSTRWGGGYYEFGGTSAATPHVAGALAILLQARPNLTPTQADMILQTTAVDLGDPGKDNVYGSGRLDCFAALQKTLALDTLSTLRVRVLNASTQDSIPLANVTINTSPPTVVKTNSKGEYETLVAAGSYVLNFSAFGYAAEADTTDLIRGELMVVDALLDPVTTTSLTGITSDASDDSLTGAFVRVLGTPLGTQTTDSSGRYVFPEVPGGALYTLEAVKFNYHAETDTVSLVSGSPDTLDLTLQPGLFDDFEIHQGWTVGMPGDNATGGIWERGDPVPTFSGATMVQPDLDYSPVGTLCFLTGNCNPGATQTFSDVDGGTTTLLSPMFDGTIYDQPVLRYRVWYSNDTQSPPGDVFRSEITTNGGTSWVPLEATLASNRSWVERRYDLGVLVTLTPNMRLRFIASDTGVQSVVEAAVDEIEIFEATADLAEDSVDGPSSGISFVLLGNAPNPFAPGPGTELRFQLAERGPVRLAVYDVQGRWVQDLVRSSLAPGRHHARWDGRDARGHRMSSGIYLYRLEQKDRRAEGRMVLLH